MSLYDQLAFASKPNFYLAAPTTTDQSGSSTYSFGSNSLALGGQPIIKGHTKSFKLKTGATAVVLGNPIFKVGITTEFVLLAALPTENTAVILADNGNGVFLTPNSVMLNLTYNKNGSVQNLTIEVNVHDWQQKLHTIITIGTNQATLTVNGHSEIISLDGTLDETVTQIAIGSTFVGSYYFLLDGLGIYSRKLFNKGDALNDSSIGHNIYAASIYAGTSTSFDTFDQIETIEVAPTDFQFVASFMENSYFYSYRVPNSTGYVSIETNDDALQIDWDLNGANINTFTRNLVVPIAMFGGNVLSFRLPIQPQSEFRMRIRSIRNADITTSTPAFMLAAGQPIFPGAVNDSIVNCSNGVNMRYATYTGTWLTSDRVDLQVPPQTIELVVKPNEDGVILNSADGSITTLAQSGYALWLNGVPVANLNNILMNQWNHLVLGKTSAAATTFTLNTDGITDPTDMQYLLLTAYFQVLNDAAVANLYKVAIGADDIIVPEAPVVISEGSFDNTQPFQLFGNNWAIVGAGGN